jgi:TetR/AcrR family transcriptional repressor of nem operon
MARVVNEIERALRRNEILDSTQKLIYTKGYEQMAIQDLMDDLQISKGAFYHYFFSKQDLLEALVERTQRQAEEILIPIVQDPSLPALAKLELLFNTVARWKTAQKAYLLGLLRAWYTDDNSIVRQKQIASSVKWLTPILAGIIRQGLQEGVMDTPFPDHAGMIAVSLMVSLGDSIGGMLLSLKPDNDDECRSEYLRLMLDSTAAYTDAIERVLGAPTGSIYLFDPQLLQEWVMPYIK